MVDLGGYIIILMNHNGKVKLYGSPADNADNLEVGDEILEVNGRTLENATHSEVIQHIHQCIKSRTICLRVRRRSGNKMEELDGPNAGRIRDAWVIAVERGARERLQRLTALRRIQPRDIQAILHQKDENTSQINDGGASSSTITTRAEITSNQITVTVKDRECPPTEFPVKLSNGTVPKVATSKVQVSPAPASNKLAKEKEDNSGAPAKEKKESLEKQQSCPEESNNLLVHPAPSQGTRVGERRASSPFQNGRTEVLIGDAEGGPRSPRGSTSSGANDNNLLNPPTESDNPEPICRSRIRSGSGVGEIHLQENNNGSREVKEGVGPVEGPDEMWAPSALGHHRELPVDVPDTLLQQAYPNATKTGLNGVKPAIPPRDQKRAPARPPKDNRLSQNNNVEQTEPTQQQLHSIQKYKEQLRKRKDEEEKQEYLNRSLRGSRKLHALESHSTSLSGQENQAYAQDEFVSRSNSIPSKPINSITSSEIKESPKPLTYGEVVATLERLQLQLRNVAGTLGVPSPGVEAKLEAVRTLLIQRRFATALATHHALRNCLRENGKTVKPLHHTEDAANLARDCVEVLEQWQTSSKGGGNSGDSIGPIVEELTSLLTSYEIEGLLLAHDSISSYVDGLQRRQSPSSSSPSGPPSPTSSTHGSRVAENIKIIRIEKTNEPLGATVRNEGDAVIIGRVVRGGAADKSGLLHEGDEVLEVNGVEMRGKSVNEVCDILAGMQGSLTFLVLPAPVDHRNNGNTNIREDTTLIQHVRAHFDYDPEEDPYIPCRELGVSFQKGDVLHVISQEDPSWWQAYREGEEDQTLAGLVPSKSFQHQRESMKQTIAGEKSTGRGSKKSSTLLCARKNPKKKKRSKSGSNFNDDGYPLYATTAIDDYDSEEVLTYEEVALYYPRANHKRPIVLIGPPNIGRHELRQRLMQDSERFAAAIPHTSRPRKDSEVDGQDYHFISRSQFESDILCRKFVEHGEYEKAYYGTSVEAIRSVVNSGKICVLNLHPQSLKILRSSDLKPYVVFVAPPSLEKLRQKRIKNNENFKEDELKDIIEKARDMEDKYGHLFDMIIINNDTDRAYNQLLTEINSLEREPQWVPASWLQ
ncbi:protein PALS1 isoform X2 [Neodiprion pinetum]|uniref:Protein PALS1 isoform X2 n=1 Tax=Neodiprion lecontei TaxID=441921 RepID=A0ABM3GHY9_NEOLC|nr:protein PALS1 isoform X2 [Neodiprion pinetum]XP_046599894.1 protein PALS1 isoform X2 [Neodiprion lecontei]